MDDGKVVRKEEGDRELGEGGVNDPLHHLLAGNPLVKAQEQIVGKTEAAPVPGSLQLENIPPELVEEGGPAPPEAVAAVQVGVYPCSGQIPLETGGEIFVGDTPPLPESEGGTVEAG